MKSVIQPSPKSASTPLGLIAAVVADAEMHKKILGSGRNTTLIISTDEMEDNLKIVKSLEDIGLLLGVNKTITNEAKNKTDDFLVFY